MSVERIIRTAALVGTRLPNGLREAATQTVLKTELEIAGFAVSTQHPVIVTYTASNGTPVVVQTGFIDILATDTASNTTIGIELKVAATVTAAHKHQAAGYAAALGIPVVAIAYSYAQALNYELVAHT